jgi:hypothetical protein
MWLGAQFAHVNSGLTIFCFALQEGIKVIVKDWSGDGLEVDEVEHIGHQQ